MKVAMLFEDNETSSLGKLLKSSYNSNNLFFSRSNSRLYKKVKSIYPDYDKILLFFDLSPNNPALIDVLENLSSRLAESEMLNKVHIIPIICAEYIYLTSIEKYLSIVVKDLEISNAVGYHKSCEKYYKDLIEDDNIHIGDYSQNEPDYFYVSFPIFDVIDDKHGSFLNSLGIMFKDTTLESVKDKVSAFYRKVYDLFGLNFDDEVLNKEIFLF